MTNRLPAREGNCRQPRQVDVLLVSMPCGSPSYPSIAVSLLKASLAPLSVSSEAVYFTFRFAKMAGLEPYLLLAEQSADKVYQGIGEWIFAGALFEDTVHDVEGYVEHILRHPPPEYWPHIKPLAEPFIRAIIRMREVAGPFLDDCLDDVLDCRPRIVGFSCLAQQKLASLALAKRIKGRMPETCVILGGADCEGPKAPEIIRQFPFVDAVVSGEGDIVLPELVRQVLAGEGLSGIQGVYAQDGPLPAPVDGRYPNAASVQNMDALPFPDFTDYFEQLAASGLELPREPVIVLETSRGCWWGEKAQCAFCSLNGAHLGFRSKGSQRALSELGYFARRYPGRAIKVTDNVLDVDYFDTVFPALGAHGLEGSVFYETRASLTKPQFRALYEAGVKTIQPGIESLSTPVLKLMRKGITALQNVQFLKWSKEFGIRPLYNIIWGFPAEPPEAYEHMARLIPLLAHLQPPASTGPVALARFSPHFEQADEFGLTDIAPSPVYDYIYPFDKKTVANLAHVFTYSYRSRQDVETYTKPLLEAIAVWGDTHPESDLFFVDKGGQLLIWDERPRAVDPLAVLDGLPRSLYLACDGVCHVAKLQRLVEDFRESPCSQEQVLRLLRPILDRGLMLQDGGSLVSLAVPVGVYAPRPASWQRFRRCFRNRVDLARQEAVMASIRIQHAQEAAQVGQSEMRQARQRLKRGLRPRSAAHRRPERAV